MKKINFIKSADRNFNIGDRIRLVYDSLSLDKMFERGDAGTVQYSGEDFCFVKMDFDKDNLCSFNKIFLELESKAINLDGFVHIKSYEDVSETTVDYYYNPDKKIVKCVRDLSSIHGGVTTSESSLDDFEDMYGDSHVEIMDMIYDKYFPENE